MIWLLIIIRWNLRSGRRDLIREGGGGLFSVVHRGGWGFFGVRAGGKGTYQNDSAHPKTNGEPKGPFKRAIS